MNSLTQIKYNLLELCKEYVEQKIDNAQEAIDSAQNSANEEAKGGLADTYETGRSMMQLEIEKYSTQLEEGFKLRKSLAQIDIKKFYEAIQPGALAETTNGNYFISISAGKLIVEEIEYFAISLSSPIGQLLANRKINDEFEFKGKIYRINNII